MLKSAHVQARLKFVSDHQEHLEESCGQMRPQDNSPCHVLKKGEDEDHPKNSIPTVKHVH